MVRGERAGFTIYLRTGKIKNIERANICKFRKLVLASVGREGSVSDGGRAGEGGENNDTS